MLPILSGDIQEYQSFNLLFNLAFGYYIWCILFMMSDSMEEPVSVDVEIFREIYMQIDEKMFWILSLMCARYRGLTF